MTKSERTKNVKNFDVVIVGGGVGGMSAAVYAKRRGLSVAIIEKFALGGTVNGLLKISNFPSQKQIDGQGLVELFSEQIHSLDVQVLHDDILSTSLMGEEKHLFGKKNEYVCKSVIIATGLTNRTLGIGEEEFIGRGVSFCATCDANFFKNEKVVLASKGGSGLRSAKFLSEVCSHVTLCDESLEQLPKALESEKIELISPSKVVRILGSESVESVEIESNGKLSKIETKALFVDIGKFADVSAFEGVKTDESGFVLTDENMQTSVKGVFAVGDVRAKKLRQIVTACSDGAIAGTMC